jgi:hypothetical protein
MCDRPQRGRNALVAENLRCLRRNVVRESQAANGVLSLAIPKRMGPYDKNVYQCQGKVTVRTRVQA